jgi:Protein of unknown function (DUF2778)
MGYNPVLGRFMERDPIGNIDLDANAAPVVVTAVNMALHRISQTYGQSAMRNRSLLQYADGMNAYQAVASNPTNRVDPSGLLVDLTFNIATGEITASDRDTGERVDIPAGCSFSGGDFNGETYKPIPTGTYQILERKPDEDGKRGNWFVLDPFDSKINNDKMDGGPESGRGNFRLHPGTVSHGCVTVKNDCRELYDRLHDLLKKTKAETVKYRPGWWSTDTPKYGNIIVTNTPPPATQPTTKPTE